MRKNRVFSPVVLETERPDVMVRQLGSRDIKSLYDLMAQNRDHLGRWTDDTTDTYPTVEALRDSILEPHHSHQLRFGVWNQVVLVGRVDLSPLPDGSMELSYWIGEEFCNRGFATAAARAVIGYAAKKRGVRTFRAGARAENAASQAVLRNAGFRFSRIFEDTLLFILPI
jgi:RimJ/RimL family protein N-acetyltransferase